MIRRAPRLAAAGEGAGMTAKTSLSGAGRRDFPYYDGRPRAVSGAGWLAALAAAGAGFAALEASPHLWPGLGGQWIGALLFAALPLIGLRLAAGADWRAPFGTPSGRDIAVGLAMVPATLTASALVAFAVMKVSLTAANPIGEILGRLSGWPLAGFVASTLPQLFGEELVTLIPLLAALDLAHRRWGVSRRTAILLAWALSAALFALMHLPTYGWKLGQVLAVIGVARLMLSLSYLITKTVWASTITHVTHDWLLFAMIVATSRPHA